jgi:hypothetical protein
MLTRNYQAIADQTQRPFSTPKSARARRSWAWDSKKRKPGKVTRIDPATYDNQKEKLAC